ncbi:MAG: 2-oxoacid:acceptor oxidoreductase family protein, partial [Deltaproteobacteria bacterium]|nr:2-oxoacid:acceptor oxidoreductase family protein [Deltaproteobacteria bacterium]
MDSVDIVLCGLGGQGILFMTRVIAQAALDKGLNIMGAETHGMAQRGGSVVSHLRLGQAQGSLVRTGSAHFLLGLDENE